MEVMPQLKCQQERPFGDLSKQKENSEGIGEKVSTISIQESSASIDSPSYVDSELFKNGLTRVSWTCVSYIRIHTKITQLNFDSGVGR